MLTNDRLRWTLGLGATLGIAVMALVAAAGAALGRRAVCSSAPTSATPPSASCVTLSAWTLGYVVANQVAIVVVQNLAQPGSGNVNAYSQAYIFFVLPHGLLAMSIATTFTPEMARAVAAPATATPFIDRTSHRHPADRAAHLPRRLRRCSCCAARSSGSACSTATSTRGDALVTSRALAGFALGLVGFSVYLFVLRALLRPPRRARRRSSSTLVENLINIVLAVVLVGRFGVLGLGAAFAIAYLLCRRWALQVLSYKVPGFALRPIVSQRAPDGARRGGDGRGDVGGGPRWSAATTGWPRSPESWSPALVGIVAYVVRAGGCWRAASSTQLRELRVAAALRSRLAAMFKAFKKWWKYLGAKLNRNFDEKADPDGAARAGDHRGAGTSTAGSRSRRPTSSPARSRPRCGSTPR